MTIQKLRTTLENRFDELDTGRFPQEQGRSGSTLEGRDLLLKQAERVEQHLGEARSGLDDLLNLLQAKSVTDVDGTRLTKEEAKHVAAVAERVYISAKTAFALRTDADKVLKELAKKRSYPPADKETEKSLSLGHHVKAHFILAELYTALGVRVDRTINNYDAVIEEGKQLYKKLYDFAEQNGRPARFYVDMVMLAYDIGAAHKRKYDLEHKDDPHYGYDIKGTRIEMRVEIGENGKEQVFEEEVPIPKINPQYREARAWFHRMADLINLHNLQDISSIFPTRYEFERYLEDISQLRVACVYADTRDQGLVCAAPERFGPTCRYRERDGSSACRQLTTKKDIGDEVIRIDFMKEQQAAHIR